MIAAVVFAQEPATTQPFPASEKLQKIVDAAVAKSLEQFREKNLKDSELAITLIDLRDSAHSASGNFRGEAGVYPASVVKLFYLVAAHQRLADGKLADSPELERGLHDMIVDSLNEATQFIVDAVTGTANGAPLTAEQMTKWAEARNLVNRYFALLGYRGINVNQKTFCEGPYGRERVFLGEKFENRNKLTTDATARLLAEIVLGRAVNAERSKKMMELLHRDRSGKARGNDDQAHGFTALALGDGDELWSKAGWTSTARHDAAYVVTPDGLKFVLVVFTTNHANERQIIPTVAREVMRGLREER